MEGMGPRVNGTPASKDEPLGPFETTGMSINVKTTLDTYIYDYFLKNGHVVLAKAMRESDLKLNLNLLKPDGNRPDINGVDDPTDSDTKDDKRVEGLPRSMDAFLMDWWTLFWDLWSASRNRSKNPSNMNMAQYYAHTQNKSRMLEQASRQPAMMQANYGRFGNMAPNGMPVGMNGVNMEMQRRALTNNARNLPPHFQQMRHMQQQQQQQQQMAQTQMQREGSELGLSGQPRSGSPMSGDSAPSPKRQRIDPGQFSGQNMAGIGRGQPGAAPMSNGATAAMLMQSGIDPSSMTVAQYAQFGAQGPMSKQQQMYAQDLAQHHQKAGMNENGLSKGMVNMNGYSHDSPLMQAGPDGQMQISPEFLNAGQAGQLPRGNSGGSSQGGALADYQIQLMLLEQQNKKRLMLARQEQDVPQRDGGVGPAQPGMAAASFAPRMSPRGSRTGHSPNANNEMQRNTPKIRQISPIPDAGQGSPAPNGFESRQNAHFFQPQLGISGNMRPPINQHNFSGPNGLLNQQQQMELLARQQNGARMNGNWQTPHMVQVIGQGQVQQQQQMDPSQPRTQMPPPQAPPTGRTQPPSPQPSGAPATPSQGKKANPKSKKGDDKNKKGTKKNAAANTSATTTGVTPSSEIEQPPTPTPPTPITPVNAQSFSIGSKPLNSQTTNPPPQPPVAVSQGPIGVGLQDAGLSNGPFGSIDHPTDPMQFGGMDFDLGTADVLDGFVDFDSLIDHDGTGDFDFDGSQFLLSGDPVETGPNET